ncbi:MAG TPA: amidophosphoribosyltransferase [Lachnospiraceae bacterium]|nr:ComF family protein [Lachnospiraceae bacterium]MDD7665095.1 ComF family protein [Lachnospiraceae bacterium]MDY4165528.1 ComF family protein [Lachnospiraceae bacterium]HAP03313.1 amidophosphoribosyltransferase [Lachnospiraceae bacterium]
MKMITKEKLSREARRLLFPPRCPSCDGLLAPDENSICRDCEKLVVKVQGNFCKTCGKPLKKRGEIICSDCSRYHHIFSEGRPLYEYEGPVREAVYRFKYKGRKSYADAFAYDAMELWGEWIKASAELIVPVPMNAKKLRQRGYDQADVLARAISVESGIPYMHLLDRVRKTVPMKALSRGERQNNLKNAFQVRDFDVKLKRILLVDDIYTTGSTLDECARVLLANGASEVNGIYISIGG